MSQENVEIVRQANELMNGGEHDAADRLLDDLRASTTTTAASRPSKPWGSAPRGHALRRGPTAQP